jgi:hypothetical protein
MVPTYRLFETVERRKAVQLLLLPQPISWMAWPNRGFLKGPFEHKKRAQYCTSFETIHKIIVGLVQGPLRIFGHFRYSNLGLGTAYHKLTATIIILVYMT